MKAFYLLLIILLSGFIWEGCSEKKASHINLKIIQTTDVHGAIFPYDFVNGKEVSNSLAHICSFIKKTRTENPDRVILLDNGDFLQGQPSVYYYNFEDTISSHLGAEVLNYMGYDAATVGNHDIETGHNVYDRFRDELKAPYLAANAVIKSTGKPYFDPYTIIERQGLKIAVLGLITPGVPNWLPESLWEGIVFEDMVASAKKWVPIILEKEHPDLLIGMFHSGIDHTYENATGEKFMNENASRLVAENVSGFDIILAGHDHRKFTESILNPSGDTVLLLDPRSHSRAVSFINVDFNLDKKTGKYISKIAADVIAIEDEVADKEFMQKFEPQLKVVKNYVSRQLGEFTKSMDSKFVYFGNSSFMDLIHRVQLDVSGADISFSAPLSFRTKIEKGPIFVSDLFKLYKYENWLYTLSLKGSEIDLYLEYAVTQWFNTMSKTDDHLLRIEQNEEGIYTLKNKYYNFSSASGIDYLIDVTRPEGDKVRILGLSSGKSFYVDSIYTVALNSYRANGGGGHLTEGVGLSKEELKNRQLTSTENDIRYLIMNWIEKNQTIHPKKNSNWRIIPEGYYEYGKRRDMKLLFEDE